MDGERDVEVVVMVAAMVVVVVVVVVVVLVVALVERRAAAEADEEVPDRRGLRRQPADGSPALNLKSWSLSRPAKVGGGRPSS